MSVDVSRTLLAAATAGTGLVLAVRPEAVGRWAAELGGRGQAGAARPVQVPPPAAVVRVLGLRYAGQGAAQLLLSGSRVLIASAAGDAVHLLTMIAAAKWFPSRQQAASASAAFAAASALAAGVLAGRPQHP